LFAGWLVGWLVAGGFRAPACEQQELAAAEAKEVLDEVLAERDDLRGDLGNTKAKLRPGTWSEPGRGGGGAG